jgi:hypothetical protein
VTRAVDLKTTPLVFATKVLALWTGRIPLDSKPVRFEKKME